MRLIAIRNFWYENTVRGCMVPVKPGEEFSLDITKDAEQIFSLISGLRAYPIDPEYVPERAKYLCLASFSYQVDGEKKVASPQQVVTLDREQAVKYMTGGHCRPVDLNAWSPKKLLTPEDVPTGEIRKMYDPPEEKPENWVMAGRKRK